jgi:hypothetical protein
MSSSEIVSSSATATASAKISGSPSSKVWIVGAVIGPVVGLAILVGLVFWIWHLRKESSANRATQPPPGYGSGPAVEGYKDRLVSVMPESGPPPPELGTQYPPSPATHAPSDPSAPSRSSAAELPSKWVHESAELPNTHPYIPEAPGLHSKAELAG